MSSLKIGKNSEIVRLLFSGYSARDAEEGAGVSHTRARNLFIQNQREEKNKKVTLGNQMM